LIRANLLINLESFGLTNLAVDKSKEIDDLILAIQATKETQDVIFGHPDTYSLKLEWGFMYELLYFQEEFKQQNCSWLTHDHQIALMKLLNHSPTILKAKDINSLEEEFKDENNGLIGIALHDIDFYVFCPNTWLKLHQNYATSKYALLEGKEGYFKRFYTPKLKIDVNEINSLIQKKQVNPLFKRMDKPTIVENDKTLHGEEYQMHFNDAKKSALNLSGNWKHAGFPLPNDVKEQLMTWGFALP